MKTIEKIEFKDLDDDVKEYLIEGKLGKKKLKKIKTEEIDKGDYYEQVIIFSEEQIKLFKTTIKISKEDV